MRSEWVAVSAAALVVGAVALFCGALMTPRVQGQGELVRQAALGSGTWTTPAMMLLLAALGFLAGISTVAALLHPRGFALGIAGMLSIAVAAVLLAGFSMQLVLLRGLSMQETVTPDAMASVMDHGLQQGLLYTCFAAFFLGELFLAWALMLARTTPRWVPWMFLGHVVGAMLIRVVPVDGVEDLPALLMVAGFAGVAISATQTNPGVRRPERVRTRPGHPAA